MYLYGSKRWFDIGCQPDGAVKVIESDGTKKQSHRTLLVYDRKLSDEEIYKYELKFVREITDEELKCL